MEPIKDNDLLEELKKRFLDNKKALRDMLVMNQKIEKLNEKLAESEQLKTNFLSNIRNEINNPLTAILGIARQLAGPVEDEKTRQAMADTIYREAFDLDFQLRNIFIAAELESGEAQLSTAGIDVVALVRSVIASFDHKFRQKSLTAAVVCTAGSGTSPFPVFITDPEKLRLVIANLLANAIEYNHEGKRVSVEVAWDGDSIRLAVEDEGIGIPEGEGDRLFERFHQLDRGSSKKHRGHGLGLSITKAIVDMLGGRITAARASSGGARFLVMLPQAVSANDSFSQNGNEFLFEKGTTF